MAQRGRKTRVAGEKSDVTLRTRVAPSEKAALRRAQESEKRSEAAILRDALNEYLADYGYCVAR
jgi:hypothetical protein